MDAAGNRSKRSRTIPPRDITDNLFLDDNAKERFYDYKKGIVTKAVNDESNLDKHGISITPYLEAQGLTKFLAITCDTYPQLVKLFYANLREVEGRDGIDHTRLLTMVNEVQFTFTSNDLAKCFKITRFPQAITINCKEDIQNIFGKFDYQGATDAICINKGINPAKLLVRNLNLECRILHRIIAYCLIGKSGSTDKVTQLELFYTWAFFTKIQINWAEYIFHKMLDGPARRDSGLPFGFAISKFIVSKGVNVSQMGKQSFKRQSDLICDSTIRSMSYDIIDGFWQQIGSSSGASSSRQQGDQRIKNPTIRDAYNLAYENSQECKELKKIMRRLDANMADMMSHFNIASTYVEEDEEAQNEEEEESEGESEAEDHFDV